MLPYKGCLLGFRPVAFGPFAIRMFTGHSNYAHALTGSNPSCFRMKTNRHPPLFIGVPEKRELFGEKEQQRSA